MYTFITLGQLVNKNLDMIFYFLSKHNKLGVAIGKNNTFRRPQIQLKVFLKKNSLQDDQVPKTCLIIYTYTICM